jgi:hypothetical protein
VASPISSPPLAAQVPGMYVIWSTLLLPSTVPGGGMSTQTSAGEAISTESGIGIAQASST